MEEKEFTKEDLRTAWRSSEQNMSFQFSSSAYKGITFEQWYRAFKELKDDQVIEKQS